jgi:hypothetical protein
LKPPKYIDNAKVILWDWSDDIPFGFVFYTDGSVASAIFGLAICQYDTSDRFYRFCCNKNWETEQDDVYDTIEHAIRYLPEQYKNKPRHWKKYE